MILGLFVNNRTNDELIPSSRRNDWPRLFDTICLTLKFYFTDQTAEDRSGLI